MNLVKQYQVTQVLKTLQSHLFNINRYNYKTSFSKARTDLLSSGLCQSLSITLKDTNTAMISATIDDKYYILLWDFSKREIVYKGVRDRATS